MSLTSCLPSSGMNRGSAGFTLLPLGHFSYEAMLIRGKAFVLVSCERICKNIVRDNQNENLIGGMNKREAQELVSLFLSFCHRRISLAAALMHLFLPSSFPPSQCIVSDESFHQQSEPFSRQVSLGEIRFIIRTWVRPANEVSVLCFFCGECSLSAL